MTNQSKTIKNEFLVRVPHLCKRNCQVNECIRESCDDCRTSCMNDLEQCRADHCSRKCRGSQKRKFQRKRCRRCTKKKCGNKDNQNHQSLTTLLNDAAVSTVSSQIN